MKQFDLTSLGLKARAAWSFASERVSARLGQSDYSPRTVSGSRGSVFQVPVLTLNQCEQTMRQLGTLREDWIKRDGAQGRGFFTFGANSYMDLVPAADRGERYFTMAKEYNAKLLQHFPAVLEAVRECVEQKFKKPCSYHPELALPGFHIWLDEAIPRTPTASVHYDLQFEPLIELGYFRPPFETLSFTLAVQLPAAGSHLRVWPIYYEDLLANGLDIETAQDMVDSTSYDYAVGSANVQTGLVLHQIGATADVRPGDMRVTLQGHGISTGSSVTLYW